VRISFAQWLRPERRADQSSSLEGGIEIPKWDAMLVTSSVDTMDSCLQMRCQFQFGIR
jgi:hypothetical protein